MVADATTVGSPDRAKRDILGMILDVFCQFRLLQWPGSQFVIRNSLLSPKKSPQGHLIKIEWFVTDVTAIGFPVRAERDMFLGVILGVFCPVRPTFVVGDPCCAVGIHS